MLFLTSKISNDHAPVHRNAIVTMVIGDIFIGLWVELCQKEWVKYAIRHGFDIILINTILDHSSLAASRSPAWQKLLILDQPWAQKYERIVWLDADILINSTAPNILNSVPDHSCIGVPAVGGERETASVHIFNERVRNMEIWPEHWPETQRMADKILFKDTANIDIDDTIKMYCTGVMVVHPAIHRDLFRRSYINYNNDSRLYEQPGLSYEICRSGKVTEFSPRFNWMIMYMLAMYFPETWGREISPEKYLELLPMLRKELGIAYFLHFAGCGYLMQKIGKGDMELTDGRC